MRRREFIARLGAAGVCAAVPRVARAQQGTRVRRVAVLAAGAEDTTSLTIFRNELAKLGWVEGRNLRIDYRIAGGNVDRMRAIAVELIGLGPDVIAIGGAPMVRVAQQQTQTIPIIVAQGGDLLVNGLVKNLAHPEGNTTGVTNLFASIAGKWVELLKAAVPQVQRVALVQGQSDSPFSDFLSNVEEASRALGLQATEIHFRNSLELARGIDAFAARPDGGLVIAPGPPSALGTAVNTLAIQYRLPAVYGFRTSATEGGLIVYAPRLADQIVRASSFVDRILRGAKPGDLPVEYPTRFEKLIVNLKTAKAIGVTIREAFLARADEVIE
jgi:putative tryptophan/tyrosine transport system substrate-binding protein